MATSNTYENMAQCKTCRCGEGDTNIWTTRTSDNPDKQIQKCPNCQVLKSGTLFLSSKGIGWTSWKKRWFILTRTSLVFYRSDPNATPQKGSEANLTLGGIDLNSSGSVVVKADKKLLTVLFPDGRDGRTFTLKAETSEDLYEWKTAIENALAQAPSPALAMGQNGILRNDAADSVEASSEQFAGRDKRPVKSMVVGRPILLALEDLDGSPSFLEKALRFIEDHGIKVEGILRQSADVEEVERRVREYEQGKVEFSADEDAHIVGDCIKHILRELPSSPVPATSCTALVEAYRTDRGSRINAMRAAIADTFPEPNRRLVQRILKMMRTVASHKSVNRMTLSAVAACMAPLLLRPLLAGDCELEDDFNMGGDGSLQLLQAAAAANHAQAIVIILLEEYERVFDDDLLEEASLSSDLYTESEDGDVEDEDLTDNDNLDDDEYNYPDNGLEADIEDDQECSSSGTHSESNSYFGDSYDNKASDDQISNSSSEPDNEDAEVTETLSNATQVPVLQQTSTDISIPRDVGVRKDDISHSKNTDHVVKTHGENTSKSQHKLDSHSSPSSIAKCTDMSYEPLLSMKQPTVWGRAPARKNHSMESIDFSSEDEIAIQRLEMTKSDLQTKIAKEEKGNAVLQANLEKRKEVLQERRLALEQDVERLQELLQKERDLKACLETGLMNLGPGQLPITSSMDSKTRADLEEIAVAEADINNLKQKATDLHGQLSQQRQQSYASFCESCSRQLYAMYQPTEMKQQKDVGSTTPVHQNEILRNNENVSFGAVDKDVNTQISRSTSSPKSQLTTKQHLDATTQNNTSYADELHNGICGAALKKSSSSWNENSMLDTECGNAKYQTQDSPSSPNKPQKKLQPNITNQRSMAHEGSINVSSIEPTTFGHDTSSKKSSPRGDTVNKEHVFEKSKTPMSSSTVSCAREQSSVIHAAASPTSSRDENSMHGARYENVKTQSQDFPSSPNNQSPQKLQSKTTNQCNKTPGSNTISSTEETETSGQRAHCENVRTQTQDSPSSPDKHSPRNLQPNPTSQSGNRSLGPSTVLPVEEPTTFRRSTVSKRSSFRYETQKRDNQDPPTNRQLSQKQQPNSALLNSMKSIGPSSLTYSEEMNRNATFKRSSTRTEETAASSSSALAKLTSRLNFLKERRVQLANELQNLDVSRPFGPEGPPRTNPR